MKTRIIPLFIALLILIGCSSQNRSSQSGKDLITGSIDIEEATELNPDYSLNRAVKDFIPQLEVTDPGWEIAHDYYKDYTEWPTADQAVALSRGFYDGHYKVFVKTDESKNITDKVGFSVSIYDPEKIYEVFWDKDWYITQGRYHYNITYYEHVFYEDYNEWFSIKKNTSGIVYVERVEIPDIGEESAMMKETENDEFRAFVLFFYQNDVWVEISCYGQDQEILVDECINYARYAEDLIR